MLPSSPSSPGVRLNPTPGSPLHYEPSGPIITKLSRRQSKSNPWFTSTLRAFRSHHHQALQASVQIQPLVHLYPTSFQVPSSPSSPGVSPNLTPGSPLHYKLSGPIITKLSRRQSKSNPWFTSTLRAFRSSVRHAENALTLLLTGPPSSLCATRLLVP